ncbi:hypothetical protein ACLKA6_006013 [Drosophila palustris]
MSQSSRPDIGIISEILNRPPNLQEGIPRQQDDASRDQPSTCSGLVDAAGEICHYRECRNRQLYYCWRCEKRGIKTTECCVLAGKRTAALLLPQDQVRAASNPSREYDPSYE